MKSFRIKLLALLLVCSSAHGGMIVVNPYVFADHTAPTLLSAEFTGSDATLVLTFSESVTSGCSGLDECGFYLNGGFGNLIVTCGTTGSNNLTCVCNSGGTTLDFTGPTVTDTSANHNPLADFTGFPTTGP